MLESLEEKRIECPHCGHHLHIVLDPTAGDQNYYDECPACCCDIHLDMHIDEVRQKIDLQVDADDEQVF
ncbi:CPXCG motif-containing cysteine-rich protein [Thalassotalea sp. M1531]|uniref:CPXCG motif-containing cysteine-rich protein n=1 Tax=Thalassotalea algicola TaxID=2716224 RepID=A0A7Y0LDB1_9GAMM|nr:CPXCG motif-containing cysteine-rich protein [Thalassotalea algicola]NMP32443.1 CPXCG motif-containing cysteine-rich protein [Thalassotalea algicola]